MMNGRPVQSRIPQYESVDDVGEGVVSVDEVSDMSALSMDGVRVRSYGELTSSGTRVMRNDRPVQSKAGELGAPGDPGLHNLSGLRNPVGLDWLSSWGNIKRNELGLSDEELDEEDSLERTESGTGTLEDQRQIRDNLVSKWRTAMLVWRADNYKMTDILCVSDEDEEKMTKKRRWGFLIWLGSRTAGTRDGIG